MPRPRSGTGAVWVGAGGVVGSSCPGSCGRCHRWWALRLASSCWWVRSARHARRSEARSPAGRAQQGHLVFELGDAILSGGEVVLDRHQLRDCAGECPGRLGDVEGAAVGLQLVVEPPVEIRARTLHGLVIVAGGECRCADPVLVGVCGRDPALDVGLDRGVGVPGVQPGDGGGQLGRQRRGVGGQLGMTGCQVAPNVVSCSCAWWTWRRCRPSRPVPSRATQAAIRACRRSATHASQTRVRRFWWSALTSFSRSSRALLAWSQRVVAASSAACSRSRPGA